MKMTGHLSQWLCADGWRAEDDCSVKLLLRLETNRRRARGPCIHRINSVYCILSTDTYTMLMSVGVIRKIHCIVLYWIQIQSLIETIEEPTIFLFIRDTANVVCKIITSVLQPSAEGSKVLRRWVSSLFCKCIVCFCNFEDHLLFAMFALRQHQETSQHKHWSQALSRGSVLHANI